MRLREFQPEERRALRAVKRTPEIVEQVKGLPAEEGAIKRALRRVRWHISAVAPVFLPDPLQEALERAHEALVACRLVLEDWKVIPPERRRELLEQAELLARSAAEILRREGI